MMNATPPCASRWLPMVLSAFCPAVLSLALASAASARPECEEDRLAGEAPTITSRFDLVENRAGTTYVQARERAAHWCAERACTTSSQSRVRTPTIYALGVMRGRFVAGFRCVAPAAPAEGTATQDIGVTFPEPGGVDEALTKARQQCAPAGAELIDLQKRDGAIHATFVCAR
jgi:hypothetical protein